MDGCAGQYKNCKNLINLFYHKCDFDVDAKCVFFPTSHGKQPCDGIGGTVKRLAFKASLEKVNTSSILNTADMFEFCLDNTPGIDFHFISKEKLDETRARLIERFNKAVTIPGTRSFHEFQPLSQNTICMKYCSEDEEFATRFSFAHEEANTNRVEVFQLVKSLDFVCCLYDQQWWVGMILEKNNQESDLHNIKFMHPHGPSPSFMWPSVQDVCWVPSNQIALQDRHSYNSNW